MVSIANTFPIPRTALGEQIVYPTDHGIEVVAGDISGHSGLSIQAYSNTASTNEEDVWAQTGVLTPNTVAAALDIVSTLTTDDGNPTTSAGLQTLTVTGLDASFAAQEVTYTMNGTTIVTTGETWMRVNKVVGTTWGTYHGANLGLITLVNTGGGAAQATIEVGTSITQKSHYSVPAGKTAYLTRFDLNVDAAKTAIFKLWCVMNIDDVIQPFTGGKILLHRVDGVKTQAGETLETPLQIPEKSDIWWTVESAASGTDVHVDYDLEFIDN